MIKQQTTTHHPPPTNHHGLTDAGQPFVWKYRRGLGVVLDSYERRTPRVGRSEGWWMDVEPRQPRRGTVCSTHHVQRTPSGRCDLCD